MDEDYSEDKEGGIYTEEGREKLAEDEDEITNIDSGFMQGYNEGERLAKCGLCKKPLADDFIEEEIEGEIHRFCTEEHADAFMKKKTEEEL